jgi:hypothetical protein
MQQTHSSQVGEEPSAESKLDDVFDKLLSGVESDLVWEEFYIEVNRVVLAALREHPNAVGTPLWLTGLLRVHSAYDVMAALMRAIRRHE